MVSMKKYIQTLYFTTYFIKHINTSENNKSNEEDNELNTFYIDDSDHQIEKNIIDVVLNFGLKNEEKTIAKNTVDCDHVLEEGALFGSENNLQNKNGSFENTIVGETTQSFESLKKDNNTKFGYLNSENDVLNTSVTQSFYSSYNPHNCSFECQNNFTDTEVSTVENFNSFGCNTVDGQEYMACYHLGNDTTNLVQTSQLSNIDNLKTFSNIKNSINCQDPSTVKSISVHFSGQPDNLSAQNQHLSNSNLENTFQSNKEKSENFIDNKQYSADNIDENTLGTNSENVEIFDFLNSEECFEILTDDIKNFVETYHMPNFDEYLAQDAPSPLNPVSNESNSINNELESSRENTTSIGTNSDSEECSLNNINMDLDSIQTDASSQNNKLYNNSFDLKENNIEYGMYRNFLLIEQSKTNKPNNDSAISLETKTEKVINENAGSGKEKETTTSFDYSLDTKNLKVDNNLVAKEISEHKKLLKKNEKIKEKTDDTMKCNETITPEMTSMVLNNKKRKCVKFGRKHNDIVNCKRFKKPKLSFLNIYEREKGSEKTTNIDEVSINELADKMENVFLTTNNDNIEYENPITEPIIATSITKKCEKNDKKIIEIYNDGLYTQKKVFKANHVVDKDKKDTRKVKETAKRIEKTNNLSEHNYSNKKTIGSDKKESDTTEIDNKNIVIKKIYKNNHSTISEVPIVKKAMDKSITIKNNNKISKMLGSSPVIEKDKKTEKITKVKKVIVNIMKAKNNANKCDKSLTRKETNNAEDKNNKKAEFQQIKRKIHFKDAVEKHAKKVEKEDEMPKKETSIGSEKRNAYNDVEITNNTTKKEKAISRSCYAYNKEVKMQEFDEETFKMNKEQTLPNNKRLEDKFVMGTYKEINNDTIKIDNKRINIANRIKAGKKKTPTKKKETIKKSAIEGQFKNITYKYKKMPFYLEIIDRENFKIDITTLINDLQKYNIDADQLDSFLTNFLKNKKTKQPINNLSEVYDAVKSANFQKSFIKLLPEILILQKHYDIYKKELHNYKFIDTIHRTTKKIIFKCLNQIDWEIQLKKDFGDKINNFLYKKFLLFKYKCRCLIYQVVKPNLSSKKNINCFIFAQKLYDSEEKNKTTKTTKEMVYNFIMLCCTLLIEKKDYTYFFSSTKHAISVTEIENLNEFAQNATKRDLKHLNLFLNLIEKVIKILSDEFSPIEKEGDLLIDEIKRVKEKIPHKGRVVLKVWQDKIINNLINQIEEFLIDLYQQNFY